MLFVSFSAWVAAGNEASDVDGIGATLPAEWIFQAAALLLTLIGAIWMWRAAKRKLTRKRSTRSIPLVVVNAFAAGMATGGVISVLIRHSTGNPNGIDYVTPQGLWNIGIGLGVMIVTTAPMAIRKLRRAANPG